MGQLNIFQWRCLIVMFLYKRVVWKECCLVHSQTQPLQLDQRRNRKRSLATSKKTLRYWEYGIVLMRKIVFQVDPYMLNVWYIYLHLDDFVRANVGKYTSTIFFASGEEVPWKTNGSCKLLLALLTKTPPVRRKSPAVRNVALRTQLGRFFKEKKGISWWGGNQQ